MIRFKACPRCKEGDLVLMEDIFGKYWDCMQCGYTQDIVDDGKNRKPSTASLGNGRHLAPR